MKHPTSMKWVAFAVVVLFIGLACAPSLHANVSTSEEPVEITTEICGLPGMKPQTVQLTTEDAEAVDRLFEEIKSKLDNVESREEAVEIFNEAIVELNEYGLLGGLSIEQAQKLVTGKYHNERIVNILELLFARSNKIIDDNENVLCLIAGISTSTCMSSALELNWWRVLVLINTFLDDIDEDLRMAIGIIWLAILLPIMVFDLVRPLYLWGHLLINQGFGFVFTIGLNGVKKWHGTLEGKYGSFGLYYDNAWAVKGFTGLEILLYMEDFDICFYLGSAFKVGIVYVE